MVNKIIPLKEEKKSKKRRNIKEENVIKNHDINRIEKFSLYNHIYYKDDISTELKN